MHVGVITPYCAKSHNHKSKFFLYVTSSELLNQDDIVDLV